ncbi:MAG: hypothetical protein RDU89_04915 [bacterium]|nr:hypothetical protein [bacterium]
MSVKHREIDGGRAAQRIAEALLPYAPGAAGDDTAWLRAGAADSAGALARIEGELPPGELRRFLAEIATRVRPEARS